MSGQRPEIAKSNAVNTLNDLSLNLLLIDSIDVIRWKKDKVKIVDFGPLDERVTKNMLFTLEELHSSTKFENDENVAANSSPEFRFIAENMGIQPTTNNHFCFPREINEYFQSPGSTAMIDMIQRVSRSFH